MEKLQVHMLQWTLRGGNKWSKPFGSRILYAYLLINLSPRLQEQVDDLHVTLGGCHVQGRGPRLWVGNIPQAPCKKNVLMCFCFFLIQSRGPEFFLRMLLKKKIEKRITGYKKFASRISPEKYQKKQIQIRSFKRKHPYQTVLFERSVSRSKRNNS